MKDWIDPSSLAGEEKLLKACLALRNNSGGHLLIGGCRTSVLHA